MQELVPYKTKENLYYSAYARAIADFLVGINLSRSVSLRMQSEFASRNSENGDLSGLKRKYFRLEGVNLQRYVLFTIVLNK